MALVLEDFYFLYLKQALFKCNHLGGGLPLKPLSGEDQRTEHLGGRVKHGHGGGGGMEL